MLFSKAIDQCALYDLHKKRIKKSQFSFLPKKEIEVGDIQFYIENLNNQKYIIYKFRYTVIMKMVCSCNEVVIGEALLTKNEDALNIIFVHGWYHLWGSWARLKRYVYNDGHIEIMLNRIKTQKILSILFEFK